MGGLVQKAAGYIVAPA